MSSPVPSFVPHVADYADRVRTSFARQSAMRTLRAEIVTLAPGVCAIAMPVFDGVSQQHGFVHAGFVATLGDSAGGYAAFTLMPADASVLTTEFKINLLAPARGERLIATGTVLKPGRTLSIVRVDVTAFEGGRETLVAAMQMTTMVMKGMPDQAAAKR